MFVIGSNLKPNEALDTLKSKCGEFNFPQTLTVTNLLPRDIVGASVGLFLNSTLKQGGVTECKVEFPTFAHLMEFVTDMEVVAKLSQAKRAVMISFSDSDPVSELTEETSEEQKDAEQAEDQTEENDETVEKAPKRGRKSKEKGVDDGN